MQKRLILDSALLDITVNRLCHQLIENHGNFEDVVIIGLQPRGLFVSDMIAKKILNLTGKQIDAGYLDTTFYRDDFRRRETPVKANSTSVDFIIEGKKVILVDDVLHTGRSTRAALDAMIAFGRPKKVELLVLVNRKYGRDLPIEPDYIGKSVNTMDSQRVLAEWEQQGFDSNNIWLTNIE